MKKNNITGLALVSLLFAIAGIVISTMTIKEDVTSTAKTIFEYFPSKYGVTPASTWAGAMTLGIFISVFQVVASSVAFSKNFHITNRIVATFALGISLVFDNWTDVVFRSGYLSGNTEIAWITTVAFYTLGSEIMQGLSWLVVFSTWRVAVSDFMWGLAKFNSGLSSIGSEWNSFKRAANNKENSERSFQPKNENQSPRPYFSDDLRKKLANQQPKTQPNLFRVINNNEKSRKN